MSRSSKSTLASAFSGRRRRSSGRSMLGKAFSNGPKHKSSLARAFSKNRRGRKGLHVLEGPFERGRGVFVHGRKGARAIKGALLGAFARPIERIKAEEDRRDSRWERYRYGPYETVNGEQVRRYGKRSWGDFIMAKLLGTDREDQLDQRMQKERALQELAESANQSGTAFSPPPSRQLMGRIGELIRRLAQDQMARGTFAGGIIAKVFGVKN